jgi:hypothetical protein
MLETMVGQVRFQGELIMEKTKLSEMANWSMFSDTGRSRMVFPVIS